MQVNVNFKTAISTISAIIPLPKPDLDLVNRTCTLFYVVLEPIQGATLYQKPIRFDNNGVNPSFENWYANYNSDQFLLDDFFNHLTPDEAIIITKQ